MNSPRIMFSCDMMRPKNKASFPFLRFCLKSEDYSKNFVFAPWAKSKHKEAHAIFALKGWRDEFLYYGIKIAEQWQWQRNLLEKGDLKVWSLVEFQFFWSWLGFFKSTMSTTYSRPWKCNLCGKITSGNNHTRVSFFIFIYIWLF